MDIEQEDPAIRRFRERVQDSEDNIDEQIEPEDSDGEEFEVGAEAEGDPGARGAKKRDRGANLWQELQKEREEKQRISERLARLEGVAASLPHPSQMQPHRPERDPIDEHLDQAREEQRNLYAEFEARMAATEGKMSADERKKFDERNAALEDKRIQLQIQKHAPRMDPEAIARQNMQMQIDSRHPDVMGDPQRRSWTQARFWQLRAEGMSDSWETLDLAANEARKRFGGQAATRPPSDSRKARFTGAPRGGGSSGGQKTYRMTDVDKRLAAAMFPNEKDERKRNQMWVNSVGKRKMRSE